jgi:sulfate permease, SulP family
VLAGYQRSWLRGDLVAGLTVAAYLVPQVMAYSGLAGLPPVAGLWAILLPLALYAVLGSSRQLSVGPESTTALMTASAIAPLATGDPGRYATLAATLAVVTGLLCLVAWAVRLGFVADLLSKPILVGYMAGIALIMIVSQLGKITGAPVNGEGFFARLTSFARELTHIHMVTLLFAVAVLAFLFVVQWRFPRIPGPLLAVLLGTLAVTAFGLERYGITVVGSIPAGLPIPALPALRDIPELLLPAVGILVVGYSDTVLTGRAFAKLASEESGSAAKLASGESGSAAKLASEESGSAAKLASEESGSAAKLASGESGSAAKEARTGGSVDATVDANQELLALGAANLGAGLLRGFPVSSSASRTALADAAGGRTQMYSLVSLACVLGVLLFLSPLLARFPTAALGAIIVFAAVRLIDVREFRRLVAFRRTEFMLALASCAGVLIFDILYGILLAIAISVAEMLARVARPHDAIQGLVPGLAGMHDVDDYPEATLIPGLIVYRYDSPLFFANAEDFRGRALAAATHRPGTAWFVLNVEATVEVDITGLDAMEAVRAELTGRGIVFALARVKQDLLVDLDAFGLTQKVGADRIFPTLPTAVAAYQEWAEHQPTPPARPTPPNRAT